jgi:uncharacterized protein DUF6644
MSLLNICTWVEGTPIGLFVRESLWGFPTLVAIHIMGLAVSAGMVVWFDLRLLGWSMRGSPVSVVYRQLMPWAFGGFFVMFVTGSMLLTGAAVAAYGNLYFRVKVSALVLAGVNALVYHTVTERSIKDWNEATLPPLPVRLAGLISVVLWTTVILAGRMMSYTLYSR